jgi:DNA polymerase III sliding clamp (beta) subunit (PCNA family)
MAGQIKKMLDQIISKRSNGNALVISTTKTKLVLKGLNPDQFTANSEDNADIIKKVREVAAEMGVAL